MQADGNLVLRGGGGERVLWETHTRSASPGAAAVVIVEDGVTGLRSVAVAEFGGEGDEEGLAAVLWSPELSSRHARRSAGGLALRPDCRVEVLAEPTPGGGGGAGGGAAPPLWSSNTQGACAAMGEWRLVLRQASRDVTDDAADDATVTTSPSNPTLELRQVVRSSAGPWWPTDPATGLPALTLARPAGLAEGQEEAEPVEPADGGGGGGQGGGGTATTQGGGALYADLAGLASLRDPADGKLTLKLRYPELPLGADTLVWRQRLDPTLRGGAGGSSSSSSSWAVDGFEPVRGGLRGLRAWGGLRASASPRRALFDGATPAATLLLPIGAADWNASADGGLPFVARDSNSNANTHSSDSNGAGLPFLRLATPKLPSKCPTLPRAKSQ